MHWESEVDQEGKLGILILTKKPDIDLEDVESFGESQEKSQDEEMQDEQGENWWEGLGQEEGEYPS